MLQIPEGQGNIVCGGGGGRTVSSSEQRRPPAGLGCVRAGGQARPEATGRGRCLRSFATGPELLGPTGPESAAWVVLRGLGVKCGVAGLEVR